MKITFPFLVCVATLFTVLKLSGVITWPWIWVLAPAWIPLVLAFIAWVLAFIAWVYAIVVVLFVALVLAFKL